MCVLRTPDIMSFYSAPPPLKEFSDAKPTLLVAWWTTLFCTCLILLRLAGQYIRVEKLFVEDKIAAGALVPLYLRIACVHVVLLYGTNNAQLDGSGLSPVDLDKRATGSKVVLAARVFYAATLWTLKFTTLEFLGRLAGASMKKLYQRLIIALRVVLVVTFVAVVISDLAECQPFASYWQVVPDPGPKCRQAFSQLLTMGVSSAILDAILVIFPVPIIVSTRIATKRKVLLVMLFCFGFLTVGITAYRLPTIIGQNGDQIVRSMWASIELLAATTVANLVALGSFLRDSGVRKTKFRPDYHSSGTASRSRQKGQPVASDWYESETARHKKSDSDDWVDEERSNTTTEVLVKNDTDNQPRQHTEARGGASPTNSHDSLIRQGSHGMFSRGSVAADVPRPPSPAVTAGMGGLQRR
ncbi:integral membrane protein Pth11-like [Purpureocillium lavendulum]|uniref:Integral membrane protein Pth11-like n=1 Tax=Purpureocillium lavendulum TaxID=1247861 RepID=A0AB34G886_9HYPO|nr:integral membrane protein Pth11-like [Purpureocillium lavendulum]